MKIMGFQQKVDLNGEKKDGYTANSRIENHGVKELFIVVVFFQIFSYHRTF